MLLSAALYSFASDREFDNFVSEVAHRYDAHATRIPIPMSVVSLCARVATHGGVKDLRVAEIDNLKPALDLAELTTLVRKHLGTEWQPFISQQERQGGSLSVIFVRQRGDGMRMMIADYDRGELDVVQMEVSGDRLATWMKDPKGEARRHGN
jgi:hypothetical protein